jgi:transposase
VLPEVTMARRKLQHPRSKTALPPQRAAVNLPAAGLDVGAEAQYVAVPPSDDPQPVRCCGAYTVDLESLADWLAACEVTTIALESTGVYWIPLFELLERRGFAVLLVDPPQVQKIQGRPKRDVHDCQWRQRLHTFGLLAGACRPPDQVCGRRRSLRQRAMFLSSASQPIQHRQKALPQLTLKRPHVVSDVTGETGMAILRAMLAGERDPVPWARLRNDRCHHDEEPSAKALHGQWWEEHRLALGQAVALYDM